MLIKCMQHEVLLNKCYSQPKSSIDVNSVDSKKKKKIDLKLNLYLSDTFLHNM